ncbi:MAG: ABC transporter permease [Holosporales bacterium]|jgi:ABC-2 type transport system permease protein|nr:ABC transporter permease [Holosporales bacterium]
MLFTGVGALIRKELLNLLRDPKSAGTIFFPIVLFLVLFVLATTKDVKDSSVVIFNQDRGIHSVNLLDNIVNTDIFKETIYVNSEKELQKNINDESAFIGIAISSNFSKNIDCGKKSDILIVTDGRRTNSATIVYGYLSQILSKYQAKLLPQTAKNPPGVTIRTWYNPNKNQRWFSITNLICMIIVSQAITLTALAITREKEQGTFDQLLVSPIKPLGMLIGKITPSILISLFMGTCVMLCGRIFYGVPINGSLLLMLFSMTAYVVSVVGIGVCIAAFANTQQQAMLGTFIIQMPMASLSGLMSPVESIENPIMKIFVKFNPVVYGNKLVRGIMIKDMSFFDAAESILVIMCIGAIVIAIACTVFVKKHRIKVF